MRTKFAHHKQCDIITERIILLIFIAIVVALLPLIIARDFTPSNELRYLSIADEALHRGLYFAFTNHGEIYADKPPLYLWIVMLGRKIFGCHLMWFLSFFSLVPTFIVAYIFDLWIRRSASRQTRITAILLLLSSDLFIGAGIILRMDMLMCMFIVIAFYLFYQMEVNRSTKVAYTYLFPLCIFMAVFTKGPMGILIPLAGTTGYLLLTKRIRAFHHYWGMKTWCILFFLCAVWFTCVYQEGGIAYIKNQLLHQTFGRAIHSFRHDHPFYYYIISYWYTIAPWSILGLVCLIHGTYRNLIQTTEEKFFLTVSVSTFILLSLISSKIEIYMLPAIPFFIYFTTLLFYKIKESALVSLALFIPSLLFALVLPCLIIMDKYDLITLPTPALIPAAIVFSAAGIASMTVLFIGKKTYSIYSLFAGLFAAVFCIGLNISTINPYIGYRHVCQTAKQLSRKYDLSYIYVYKMSRIDDIDVYIKHPALIIDDDAKENEFPRQGIVILPQETLDNGIPKGYIRYDDEPYAILVYNKHDTYN